MGEIIQILGGPGSGVSSLAAAFSKMMDYTVLDLDDYHWLPSDPPYMQVTSREQKYHRFTSDFHHSHYPLLIAGSLSGWADEYSKYLRACVFLGCESKDRIRRIRLRERSRFGDRIKLGGDMHVAHIVFMEWASLYDERLEPPPERSLKNDQAWVESLSCPRLTLNSSQLPLGSLINEAIAFIRQC